VKLAVSSIRNLGGKSVARRQSNSENREPSTVTNEERLAAMRELTASKRAVDEANGVHRALLKRLKGEGIDVKAALAVNTATRQDGAIVQAHEAERLRMLALRQMISIDELLSEADNLQVATPARAAAEIADAEDEGYRAGKSGVPIEDCPYPSDTDFGVAWTKWHGNGVEAARRAGGKNAQAMNASRRRPKREDDADATLSKPAKKRGRGKGYLSSAEIEEIADRVN
jgi:hypothetical protein